MWLENVLIRWEIAVGQVWAIEPSLNPKRASVSAT